MNRHILNGMMATLLPLAAYGQGTASNYSSYIGRKSGRPQVLSLAGQPGTTRPETLAQEQARAAVPVDADQLMLQRPAMVRELIVLDASIPDKHLFYQQLEPGVEVLELGPSSAPLKELSERLGAFSDLQALHLVSHASDGQLQLGGRIIDANTLAADDTLLEQLNASLVENGDILLYGCDLGASERGEEFLTLLQQGAGVDVAASSDTTGHGGLGGNWELEIRKGEIEAGLPFSEAALQDFSAVLAVDKALTMAGFPTGYATTKSYAFSGYTARLSDDVGDPSSLYCFGAGASRRCYADTPGTVPVTKLYFDFTDGERFGITSLYLYNQTNSATQFTISSDGGDSITPATIGTYAGATINLNWSGISKITIARSNGTDMNAVGLDDLVLTNISPANAAPTLGGTPADDGAVEDVATAIDLSAYIIADSDGDNITLTLAVDRGTLASVDGNGTTAGVTVASSGSASMTLAGSAADLNVYLDDTSKIEYTTASNDTASATLTVTPNDGTVDGTADTVTISITAVNDAPTLDAAQSPALPGIDEDAGDDDGSGADGDDDASNNANNSGNYVASVVVDGSVTDVDGTAVEAIAVTAVDNTNGVWQYSTDDGSSWNNFTAITGTSVDISSVARLLAESHRVRFVPASNYSGSSTLTFRAWDQSAGTPGGTANTATSGGTTAFSSASDSAQVIVTAVNDVPVFTGLDGTPAYTEGAAAITLDGNVGVSDAELSALNAGSGNFAGASLTIARQGAAVAQDTYSVQSGGNLTVAGGTVSAGGNAIATVDTSSAGTVTISFANNGTIPTTALVNEVMQAVRYANTSDDPAASVQLDWTFDDGSGGQATGSTTVSVTAVNDAPTLTATGGNPTYVEGAMAADLYNTVTAETVEAGQTFKSLTLTVSNVSDGANEILTLDGTDVQLTDGNSVVATAANALAVAVSVSGSTATVSASGGTLSAAALQTLVDGLRYRNSSHNPSTSANRVVTVTSLTDSGGVANSGSDTAAPNRQSTVSLTAVNDAPELDNVVARSEVAAGSGAQALSGLAAATLSNVDSSDHNGGFLSLSQSTGTANGNWGVDGTSVTAGGDASIAATETVQVDGVTVGTVDLVDDGQSGNDLKLNFTANATSARLQTLLRKLTYSAPSGLGDRGYTLTLNDADGTANSGDQDTTSNLIIEVTPNPPVIGNLNNDSVTAANGVAVNFDVGLDATVSDADSTHFNGGNLSIARTSALTGDFAVDGNNVTLAGTIAGSNVAVGGTVVGSLGNNISASNDLVVNFNADATPARVQTLIRNLRFGSTNAGAHTFNLTVSDGAAVSLASGLTVNVQAAPVNIVPGAQTGVDGIAKAIAGVSVSDADSASVTTTLTAANGVATVTDGGGAVITGNGSGSVSVAGTLAQVNAALAGLSFTPNADSSGAQTLQILSDDGSNSDTDTLTINVVDRPTLSGFAGAVSFIAGSSGVLLDSGGDAAVTDTDSADFNSGSLSLAVTAGGLPAEDVLTVDTSGTVSLAGTTAGSTVLVGGVVIGTLVNNIAAGTDLVMNLNADATPARVTSLVRSLRYENALTDNATAGSRTLLLTLDDGDGNSGSASVSLNVQIPEESEEDRVIDEHRENTGTLTDITITANGTVNGGTLDGDIRSEGLVSNVTLTGGTLVTGGRLSGTITGSAASPAVINSQIEAGTVLENVIIGAQSLLADGVQLGANVRFVIAANIPAGQDLSSLLTGIPWSEAPQQLISRNLYQNPFTDKSPDGALTLLRSIQLLPEYEPAGNTADQNTDSGVLQLDFGSITAALLPVSVSQAEPDEPNGTTVTVDGDIRIITLTQQQIVSYPTLVDPQAITDLPGNHSLEFDARANLRFTLPGSADQLIVRPFAVAEPASRSTVPGLHAYTREVPANVSGFSLMFEDNNNQLMQQDLFPVPGDWFALKDSLQSDPDIDSVSIDLAGVITVEINGVAVRAMADYWVRRQVGNSQDGISFSAAGDLNGDGTVDFDIHYPNGDRQSLYILP